MSLFANRTMTPKSPARRHIDGSKTMNLQSPSGLLSSVFYINYAASISDNITWCKVAVYCLCISFPVKIDTREVESNWVKSRSSIWLNLPLESVVSLNWKSSQMSAHQGTSQITDIHKWILYNFAGRAFSLWAHSSDWFKIKYIWGFTTDPIVQCSSQLQPQLIHHLT